MLYSICGKMTIAAARLEPWLRKKMVGRGVVAYGVQIGVGFGLGMLWAIGDAHAGFGDYFKGVFKSFDFSGSYEPVGIAAGGAGSLGSGWKIWQNVHDGAPAGDNVKPVVALVPSSMLLGYSTYSAALKATGNGS